MYKKRLFTLTETYFKYIFFKVRNNKCDKFSFRSCVENQ